MTSSPSGWACAGRTLSPGATRITQAEQWSACSAPRATSQRKLAARKTQRLDVVFVNDGNAHLVSDNACADGAGDLRRRQAKRVGQFFIRARMDELRLAGGVERVDRENPAGAEQPAPRR